MKRKAKHYNVGVEALKISSEQNITFREAWDIALAEKRLLVEEESKS